MRRANKKDSNHRSVGDYLRDLGWSVLDLAQYGVSVDYAVSRREGDKTYSALVEVKDGGKCESARQLTEAEKKLRDSWQGDYIVALSGPDAATQLLMLWKGWR